MRDEMSLIAIDETITQLMAMREEPEVTEEERIAIDGQIEEWVGRELRKFDSCYGYIRREEQLAGIAKQTAAEATKWQCIHDNRAIRLRSVIKTVMERRGMKKVDGSVGSFTVQTSGGKVALDIVNQSLIPEELCTYKGTISGKAWARLRGLLESISLWESWAGREDVQMVRETNSGYVRAAIDRGEDVPGARLAERGSSLVVR